MAGLAYFSSGNISNKLISDMENSLISHNIDGNISKTGEILNFLRNTVKENGDFVHFTNKLTLFKEFHHILTDGCWELRNECLQLISELIPICGDELDPCMEIILPAVINNMGHYKVIIRRSTIHTLHSYMKHANNVENVLQAIVSFGLQSKEQDTNQEYIVLSLPMLLTPEFDKENYSVVIDALSSQLISEVEERRQAAFFSLQKIKQLVGDESFTIYLQNFNPEALIQFNTFAERENTFDVTSLCCTDSFNDKLVMEPPAEETVEYGIIPQCVMRKLNNEDNWNVRCQGIETLKQIMLSLSDVSTLIPHIADFLLLLNHLLLDVNFKITTIALDIYKTLIDKMKFRIRPYLNVVTTTLSKQLADSKLVVRSKCIKALLQLMHCVSPMPTISILTGNLQHKNSRLREETINLITAALLTFPSYEFDLLNLCNSVAPMILDSKRKIRQAVLECLAVISQALGPSKSTLLIEIIENLQRRHCTDRIVLAVQGRLARRILPRVTADGLVEYSIHISHNANKRSSLYPQGSDVDWILAGSGSLSSGSASARTDGFSASSANGSSASNSSPNTPVMSRRILSPGSNKNRLPWEDLERSSSKESNQFKEKSKKYIDNGNSASNGLVNGKRHVNQNVSKNSEKQMYLQKLRHLNEKKKEKVRLTALGVSILPDKPSSVIEKDTSFNHFPTKKTNSDSNLSSTWPLQMSNSSLSYSSKKVLEPIHTSQDFFNKPIPTKPSIMRSSSAQRHQRVPPLGFTNHLTSLENEIHTWKHLHNIGYSSSSQDSIDVSVDWDTDFSGSTKLSCEDKYILNDEVSSISPDQITTKSLELDEIPFNSKPVIIQSPSLSRLKLSSALSNSSSNGTRSNGSSSGSSIINNTATSGIDSDTIVNIDRDNKYLPSDKNDENGMNVIGRGMVLRNSAHPSVKTNTSLRNSSRSPQMKNGDLNSESLSSSNLESVSRPENLQSAQLSLYEMKDKQLEPDQFSSDYNSVEESTSGEEEQFNMSMSQSTKDRLLFKKQEMLKEAEKRKVENGHWLHLENEKLELDEEEEDDEELDDDKIEISKPRDKNLVLKNSVVLQKSRISKPHLSRKFIASPPIPQSPILSKQPSPTSENSMKVELKPLRNPEGSLQEAVKLLNSSQWTGKCEGIVLVRRLAYHHSEVLLQDLHNTTVLLLREVKNLRSSVSRAAIISFESLFVNMKRYMETDLDNICKILLHKSGDSNKFIQEDIERSLSSMVDYLTPSRVGIALITGGSSHKNAAVRKLTAQLLADVADKLGPSKLLSGIKDITDKFLPAAAIFVTDCSPLTRYYGRKIFYLIIFHSNFEETLEKFVAPNVIRNIRNVLEGLKRKGLGEKPSQSPSGRFRR